MRAFCQKIIIASLKVFSIVLLFVISIILYSTYKIPYNNSYLTSLQSEFREQIKQYHSSQSLLIAEAAEVGNWADGTYCDFLVGYFMVSTMSKEKIEKIYPNDNFTAGVYFFERNMEEPLGTPWFEWKEKYLKNYIAKEGENVFVVWKSEKNYNTSGDIRCD